MSHGTLGLCANILGAFFLAKAIIAKNPRVMIRELLDLPIDQLKLFRNYLIQKLEALIGFVFLFVGSGLQIYESVQAREGDSPLTNWGITIVVTLLVLAAIALVVHRGCSFFARRIFIEVLRDMVAKYHFPIHREEKLTKQIGEVLRIPKGEDETIETYAKKVLERLNLTDQASK